MSNTFEETLTIFSNRAIITILYRIARQYPFPVEEFLKLQLVQNIFNYRIKNNIKILLSEKINASLEEVCTSMFCNLAPFVTEICCANYNLPYRWIILKFKFDEMYVIFEDDEAKIVAPLTSAAHSKQGTSKV